MGSQQKMMNAFSDHRQSDDLRERGDEGALGKISLLQLRVQGKKNKQTNHKADSKRKNSLDPFFVSSLLFYECISF